MSTPRTYLLGGAGGGNATADAGLLILRVVVGLSMALAHGLGKIPPSEGFVGFVGSLGLPAPGLMAWMAGISEFVGGLLLVVGLLTRPAAFFVAGTMAVALFGAHWNDLFGDGSFTNAEPALLFFSVAVMFVLTGAGRYSLDALLSRRAR